MMLTFVKSTFELSLVGKLGLPIKFKSRVSTRPSHVRSINLNDGRLHSLWFNMVIILYVRASVFSRIFT